MTVYRKQIVRYLLGDQRVAKGTTGATQQRSLSAKFYGSLKGSDGRSRQVPLCVDREASLTLLRRLQGEHEQRRALGIRHEYAHDKPINEVVGEFIAYLTAKGNNDKYIAGVLSRLNKIVSATKATTLNDLDASRIQRTLSLLKTSPTTINDYIVAAKSFSRWAFVERKQPDDPLRSLRKLNTQTDLRHVRRSLTPHELVSLIEATKRSGKTYRGNDWQLNPTDRAMLYLTAANTGLRANELASLTKSSFDFDAMTWTIEARSAKNRKATTLPLSPTLANNLRQWFANERTALTFTIYR
jgi:integrase